MGRDSPNSKLFFKNPTAFFFVGWLSYDEAFGPQTYAQQQHNSNQGWHSKLFWHGPSAHPDKTLCLPRVKILCT